MARLKKIDKLKGGLTMCTIVVTVATQQSGGDIPVSGATVRWTDNGAKKMTGTDLTGTANVTLTSANSASITVSCLGFETTIKTGYCNQPLLIELPNATGAPLLPAPNPVAIVSWSDNYGKINFQCSWAPDAEVTQASISVSTMEGNGVLTPLPGSQASAKISGSSNWDETVTIPPSVLAAVQYLPYFTVINADGATTVNGSTLSIPLRPIISNFDAEWNSEYNGVALQWGLGAGSLPNAAKMDRYVGPNFPPSAAPQASFDIPINSPYFDTPPGISASLQLQYQLVLSNNVGSVSSNSNILASPSAPSAPTNVVASWATEYSEVEITWSGSEYATNYQLQLWYEGVTGSASSLPDTYSTGNTSYTVALSGIPFISYFYALVAQNRFGSSAPVFSSKLTMPAPAPVIPVQSPNGPPSGQHHPLIPTHPQDK
jgi:hypothetical protein